MTLAYLWAKLMKKIQTPAVVACNLEKPTRIQAQSTVVYSSMGRYSYCGYGCTLLSCDIGRFCSIADGVTAGAASHPMNWVSTSSAFYFGQGRSIPADLAGLNYEAPQLRTVIGHDVWIGKNVMIKAGVTVGIGAVIGMGSIVTKDVPPYAVVAGNPARVIRMRFPETTVQRLLDSHWWDLEPDVLKKYVPLMDRPEEFLDALEREQ